MPDHLGAFWRPARLLPWKRASWNPNRSAVSGVPPIPAAWFPAVAVEADSGVRDEFAWDGYYPP